MDALSKEFERLQALLSLNILDTPFEEQYDIITRLAADLFDSPISLVSLVDDKRQWFKSNCGLDGVGETAREVAFCHYALLSSDVMVVEDATKDLRFANNPLVTGEPNIRFYAGAPLFSSDGYALGTLCIIDRKPKEFSVADRKRLAQLASTVGNLIKNHGLTHEVFKLAEDARWESEISRSIYNASEAAIMRLKAIRNDDGVIVDFKILGANNSLLLIADRDPSVIVGSTILEVFPSLKDTEVFDFDVQVVESGKAKTIEVPYHADGIDGWFRITGAPCGEDGLTITSTPISDRKNFEITVNQLKETSYLATSDPVRYFKGLLEIGCGRFNATDGFISEISGNEYKVRSHFGELNGMEAGSKLELQETICAVVADEQKPVAFDDMQNPESPTHPCLPSNEFGSYIGAPIYVNGKFNGTVSFVSPNSRVNPYPNSDLELATILAFRIGHALELQEAIRKLNTVNYELRMVLDNVPAKIWYKDDNNKILRANKAAVLSVGMNDPIQIEGVQTEDLFPDLAAKYLADDKAVLLAGKAKRNIIESYAPASGEEGWISTDKIPLVDENGNKSILAVATDITDIKLKEQQLFRLNESLSDFAFVASHDLQAPLRQAAMFAELFMDELDSHGVNLPGESREYLEEVQNGLRRMRAMVRSLYDLFKLDSEKIVRTKQRLEDVVNQAKKQVEVDILNASAQVDLEELFEYSINFELMVQVIQNLIVNACKYSGIPAPRIRIYSKQDVVNRLRIIVVEDNGNGIPDTFSKTIFEPFKRLHHSGDIEGAGIGLALCKKIMALHDGDLYLDSSYNSGARFLLAFNY